MVPLIENFGSLHKVNDSYAAPYPVKAASPWPYIFNTFLQFPFKSSCFAFALPIDMEF
jgi:hypothetical protein